MSTTPASRLLPSPLLSAAILVFWLLLNNTLDPGHIVLALLLAWLLPLLTARLGGRRLRLGAPLVALRLAVVVAFDVVMSNIEVARLILGRKSRIRSCFVHLPCILDDPEAVAALAGIITMTPGTLSVEISADRRIITIHSLHAPDPDAIVASIKARYERPLAEIFQCSTTRS
jgi:multicomponent K+:H+ antiporter subunit E